MPRYMVIFAIDALKIRSFESKFYSLVQVSKLAAIISAWFAFFRKSPQEYTCSLNNKLNDFIGTTVPCVPKKVPCIEIRAFVLRVFFWGHTVYN